MTGPVDRDIDALHGQELVVASKRFRVYLGLSRAGDYVHVISPRQVEVTDVDGNVVVEVGELACACKGFTFHGHCYRANQAIAFETGNAVEVAWFGERAIAPETELEKAASRG